MIVDFHTHILPHMDDGAESVEMSLAMLRAEQEQGVSKVILTPHFYRQIETPESFLQRRAASMAQLLDRSETAELPEMRLGAEVAMVKGLSHISLKPLCIENTRTLLLELPYAPLQQNTLRELQGILDRNEVTVVLAHVERYRRLWGRKTWDSVMALPVYKQLSCSALFRKDLVWRHQVFRWIKEERIHLLGSDAHNCTLRPVTMHRAVSCLRQKQLDGALERMMQTAEKLLLTE